MWRASLKEKKKSVKHHVKSLPRKMDEKKKKIETENFKMLYNIP
jgi:hypothetical protein